MSPPPKPASPVPARVDITPETVDRAAANFAIGQQDLIKAYTALSQKLSAHSSGMAGFDKAAHQFAALYDPAARAAYQAFHKAIEALGGTSLGLSQTVNNHLAADHHSRADRPGGGPPRFPPHPVTQNFAVATAPPSVLGAMSWAPNTTVPLVRHAIPHLPGWVDGLLGTSNDWPQGNPDMFDHTGDAWAEAAREIGQVASWLNWTITTILDPADNAEHTTVANYWATLYRPGDTSTIMSASPASPNAGPSAKSLPTSSRPPPKPRSSKPSKPPSTRRSAGRSARTSRPRNAGSASYRALPSTRPDSRSWRRTPPTAARSPPRRNGRQKSACNWNGTVFCPAPSSGPHSTRRGRIKENSSTRPEIFGTSRALQMSSQLMGATQASPSQGRNRSSASPE
ncbi:hypothetical protein [Actinomadura sp. NPDC048394]|uniref:hypothetical protein n=1 Tax=Actinomadura sp. NPDC048394 TaxID=3158223 RepID=UPI0033C13675